MMEDGLLWFQERNAIRPAPKAERAPGSPGRPPAPVWFVHPDLVSFWQVNQENLEKPPELA